jgi:hypothetical protein
MGRPVLACHRMSNGDESGLLPGLCCVNHLDHIKTHALVPC